MSSEQTGVTTLVTGVLEAALYVNDLDVAAQFYKALFGLEALSGDDRFQAFSVGNRNVLLLFRRFAHLWSFRFRDGVLERIAIDAVVADRDESKRFQLRQCRARDVAHLLIGS